MRNDRYFGASITLNYLYNENIYDNLVGRDPNLHFVESPALAPPEVQIDLAAQQQ